MNKFYSFILSSFVLIAVTSCNKQTKEDNESNRQVTAPEQTVVTEGGNNNLPIVFVDVDTLLTKYELAKELNEQMLKKSEKSRASLIKKQEQLQKDYQQVQANYQKGFYPTQEALENAQANLLKQDQELQQLSQKLTNELAEEQAKMSNRLKDSLYAVFDIYKAEGRYAMILSNTGNDNVLYAIDALNITEIVLNDLNARYKPTDK